jgi:hypothetical protein
VPGAYDRIARNLALAERAAHVGAVVIQGVIISTAVKQRDLFTARLDELGLSGSYLPDRRYIVKVSQSVPPID